MSMRFSQCDYSADGTVSVTACDCADFPNKSGAKPEMNPVAVHCVTNHSNI